MSSSEMGPMLRIKMLVFTTVGSPEKVTDYSLKLSGINNDL